MSRPQTLLLLNLYGAIGGAERALLELVAGLDRSRLTPLVVLGSDGPLGAALRGGGVEVRIEPFPVRPLWWLAWPPTLLRLWRAARRLSRLVSERGIRIVQCGDVLGLLLLGRARRAGVRLVYYVNYLGLGPRRRALRALAPRIDVLVAYSRFQAAAIGRAVPALVARSVVVAPGIDATAFADGDGARFRREIGVPEGVPLVGMLGRYDVWKGHDVFLDAAARVLAAGRELFFAMVGGVLNAAASPHLSRYRAAILDRREGLGLGDRVKLVEYRADVNNVLHALDIVVLPSRDEPFGMTLLEAMAAGRPVVASDSGGPAEIVEHGRSGRLFRTGDSAHLAETLCALLDDPAAARQLGQAGRAHVLECFGRARFVSAMQEVYGRLA